MALSDAGWAKVTMSYDARGNKTEEAFFGADGRPVLNANGYGRVTWRYDRRDKSG